MAQRTREIPLENPVTDPSIYLTGPQKEQLKEMLGRVFETRSKSTSKQEFDRKLDRIIELSINYLVAQAKLKTPASEKQMMKDLAQIVHAEFGASTELQKAKLTLSVHGAMLKSMLEASKEAIDFLSSTLSPFGMEAMLKPISLSVKERLKKVSAAMGAVAVAKDEKTLGEAADGVVSASSFNYMMFELRASRRMAKRLLKSSENVRRLNEIVARKLEKDDSMQKLDEATRPKQS
ncbi:MAG: hypothetical protein WC488_04480 [Candidatus Micrarchaeia archaeon]